MCIFVKDFTSESRMQIDNINLYIYMNMYLIFRSSAFTCCI